MADEIKWKVGDIAFVKEEIPLDSSPKSFYRGQTFPVTRLGKDEETGELLLAGGRFDFGIRASRCVKVEENFNPYPKCRHEEYDHLMHKLMLIKIKQKYAKAS